MENFGKVLKQAREQNGLSIKQVSVAIKVNAMILENIEKENFDQLPKTVFTRGLVKTYCKYLELDEEPILQSFDQLTNYESHTGKRVSLNEDDEPTTPFFIIVSKTLIPLFIIGVLAASGYGIFLITQKYQSEVSIVKTDDIHAIHTANEDTPAESNDDEAVPANESAKSTTTTATTTSAKPAAKDETPTKSASTQQATPTEAEVTQRITLEPSAKTLVQIQIDDEDVQKIILRPDVNRTFQAKKSIKLSISDAGAVNIIHNRKDLGVLGVLGQSIELEFPTSSPQ